MEFWNITSLPQVHYRKPDGTAPVILKVAWCSGGYLGNLVDQSICASLSLPFPLVHGLSTILTKNWVYWLSWATGINLGHGTQGGTCVKPCQNLAPRRSNYHAYKQGITYNATDTWRQGYVVDRRLFLGDYPRKIKRFGLFWQKNDLLNIRRDCGHFSLTPRTGGDLSYATNPVVNVK